MKCHLQYLHAKVLLGDFPSPVHFTFSEMKDGAISRRKIVVNFILYKPLLRKLLADKQLSQKQTRKLQMTDAISMGVCALHKTEKNEEGSQRLQWVLKEAENLKACIVYLVF